MKPEAKENAFEILVLGILKLNCLYVLLLLLDHLVDY